MKIPYPIVTQKKPFLYLTVSGFNLASVTTTGDTVLQVYRVYKDDKAIPPVLDDGALNMPPYYLQPGDATQVAGITFAPLEQKKNRFTFVMDSTLFVLPEGRYRANLYYKGTYVESCYFVYDKDDATVIGTANV